MKNLKEEIIELSGLNEDWYQDRSSEEYDRLVKLVGKENMNKPDILYKAIVEKMKIYDEERILVYLSRYALIPHRTAKRTVEENKEFLKNFMQKKKKESEDLRF